VRIIVGLLTNTMQLFSVVHCVAGKNIVFDRSVCTW